MAHRITVYVMATIVAMALCACTGKPKDPATAAAPQKEVQRVTKKDELIPVLDSLERRYEKACKVMGIANWNSYSKEGPSDLDSAKAGFARIFLDSAMAATIEEWHNRSGALADKMLARRLDLWRRIFTGGAIYADPGIATLENDLQERITNFKLTCNKKPITRAAVANQLRTEKRQQERHKLWSVASQISTSTADDLLRLIALRNAKAKKFHFNNYYALALSLQAIDEEWLIKTLNGLEEATRSTYAGFLAGAKKKYHLKEFGPWDFDYVLAKSASLPDRYFPPDSVFDIIHRFEKGIGFKVDSLPIKEVVKDIPYGGLSLAIVIPTDSRFLVNPTVGKGFYGTAFHEYGHSLKAVSTNVEYPVLKGYEWIPGAQCAAYEEGVADMQLEFTEDSVWLARYTEADEDEIAKYMEGRKYPGLYRLRRMLKDFFIEYTLYNSPNADPAEVEHAMFKKYLLVDLPENEPHQFASSIWYTAYPCYYQNYILSAMIAMQLQEALTSRFGEKKFDSPAVADWIIHQLYASGETEEWTERIRNATGKSLEPGAFLRKLDVDTVKVSTKE